MRVHFGWPAERIGLSAVAFGSFDGVHLGHQRLLASLVSHARANKERAVAITFEPHPRCVLDPANCPPRITSLEEKLALIGPIGVEETLVIDFTPHFAQIEAGDFLRTLEGVVDVSRFVVTKDFRIGRDGAGDIDWLQRQRHQVELVEELWLGGRAVHSSEVRRLVTLGEVTAAARLLGRHFSIAGPVARGDRIGTRLGFPTANLQVPPGQLIPGRGIYAGWAETAAGRRMAAISVGYRPTFDRTELRVEAFLLDFEGELYEQPLRLEFVQRLRDEIRFTGEEELKQAIAEDVGETRRALQGPGS